MSRCRGRPSSLSYSRPARRSVSTTLRHDFEIPDCMNLVSKDYGFSRRRSPVFSGRIPRSSRYKSVPTGFETVTISRSPSISIAVRLIYTRSGLGDPQRSWINPLLLLPSAPKPRVLRMAWPLESSGGWGGKTSMLIKMIGTSRHKRAEFYVATAPCRPRYRSYSSGSAMSRAGVSEDTTRPRSSTYAKSAILSAVVACCSTRTHPQ